MLPKVTMPSTKCYNRSEHSSDSIKENDKAAADAMSIQCLGGGVFLLLPKVRIPVEKCG